MTQTRWISWGIAWLVSLSLHAMMFYRQDTVVGMDQRDQAAQKTTRMSFHTVKAPQPDRPHKTKPKIKKKQVAELIKTMSDAPAKQPQPQSTSRQSTPAASERAVQSQQENTDQLQAQAKYDYLGVLLAHIEKHKFYPNSARRRGIQGTIQVSFTQVANGRIEGLKISGGHRVLQKATYEAMEAAEPLPEVPGSLLLPIALSFSIRYQLN